MIYLTCSKTNKYNIFEEKKSFDNSIKKYLNMNKIQFLMLISCFLNTMMSLFVWAQVWQFKNSDKDVNSLPLLFYFLNFCVFCSLFLTVEPLEAELSKALMIGIIIGGGIGIEKIYFKTPFLNEDDKYHWRFLVSSSLLLIAFILHFVGFSFQLLCFYFAVSAFLIQWIFLWTNQTKRLFSKSLTPSNSFE